MWIVIPGGIILFHFTIIPSTFWTDVRAEVDRLVENLNIQFPWNCPKSKYESN